MKIEDGSISSVGKNDLPFASTLLLSLSFVRLVQRKTLKMKRENSSRFRRDVITRPKKEKSRSPLQSGKGPNGAERTKRREGPNSGTIQAQGSTERGRPAGTRSKERSARSDRWQALASGKEASPSLFLSLK